MEIDRLSSAVTLSPPQISSKKDGHLTIVFSDSKDPTSLTTAHRFLPLHARLADFPCTSVNFNRVSNLSASTQLELSLPSIMPSYVLKHSSHRGCPRALRRASDTSLASEVLQIYDTNLIEPFRVATLPLKLAKVLGATSSSSFKRDEIFSQHRAVLFLVQILKILTV